MTGNPDETDHPYSLLRDCANMDYLVVERLRATVQISVDWADEALDLLIELNKRVQDFDGYMKAQRLTCADSGSCSRLTAEPDNPRYEELTSRADKGVELLLNGLRDLMTSMQNQDVIGQAVERAACALDKRASAIANVVQGSGHATFGDNEISEIHRAFQAEDDRHRAALSDDQDYRAAA